MRQPYKHTIILGLTGSVASILYKKLVEELQSIGNVIVVMTPKAEHFVSDDFDGVKVFREKQEWEWQHEGVVDGKWRKDDMVLHIHLRDRASALVIAPCSATTMGKMANGICDNLLTSIARAWDRNRPLIVAPAMNTQMWNHPVTVDHVQKFHQWGYKIVEPQAKMLACKTEGMGAMADIENIVNTVKDSLRWRFPLELTFSAPCPGIPVDGHPGSFEAKRKNSTHTGVDLYVDEGRIVFPVEDGTVVAVEPFTGPKDNSPWWLDTDCVLVEGATGVVCYGEVAPLVRVGERVKKGMTGIGRVKRVIPPDRPQHPELPGWKPSMLHMELYPHGYYKPSDGYGKCFAWLQDPTPFLLNADGAPKSQLKL
jgi:phosphopantothenoylcysteine decarboxylase